MIRLPNGLPGKWEICGACAGAGASSAYLGAFTAEAIDDLGRDWLDDYKAGAFDRPCGDCGGTGKKLIPNDAACRSKADKALLADYYADIEADAADRRTMMRECGIFEAGY